MAHPIRRNGLLLLMVLIALTALARISAAASDEAAAPFDDNDLIGSPDTLDLTALQSRFESIADKTSASVVAISAADVAPAAPESDDALRADTMNPQKLQELLDQTTRTVGAGFIIDAGGYILTNEHVVGQSEQLWVTTADHKVWPAVIIGSDPRADLAVLKIPTSGLAPVKFSQNSAFRRGQWTIALGNPYGLSTDGQSCLSVGVISATDRSLRRLAQKEDRLYSRLLQTTAQINPGNSGGPLLDIDGAVIGINTAVILPQKQTNGIGFAIPITPRLLTEVHELEQGREIVYGYLGATVSDPTPRDRDSAGAPADQGVRLDSIEDNSPAAAVLRSGDFLLTFNGTALHSSQEFVDLVGDAAVGHPVTVDVLRAGVKLSLTVIPSRRRMELAAVTTDSQRLHWRGMLLGGIPAGWHDGPDKPRSGLLVVRVDDNCPLKTQGVRAGSIITAVADRRVASVADLLTVINDVPAARCTVKLALPTTQPAN